MGVQSDWRGGRCNREGRLYITRDAAAVLLIVVMWCRAVGSQIVLSLTAEKVFVPIGHDPIWTPAANMKSKLFYLLAVGISAAIIMFRINDVTRPGLWRIIVVLAPWLAILTREMYSGSPTPDSVLYVVVVLALAALRPHPRVLIALGALVVFTAAIAIAFGFLVPDAGILHEVEGVARERLDKAVFPSLGLLQGMFTSENSLGLYLTIGIAAVAMLPRGGCGCAAWRSSGLQSAGRPVVGDVRGGVHARRGDRGLEHRGVRMAQCSVSGRTYCNRWGDRHDVRVAADGMEGRRIHRSGYHLEWLAGGVVVAGVSVRFRSRLV